MNKFLGDNIYHAKLDNNLNIYYVEKKGFQKKYASITTNYGSNDLSFKDREGNIVNLNHGIAHFLEHKMFEQPDGSDAFSKFAEYGASANAYTNFGRTAYLFSTSGEFYNSLEHLISYISEPYFTDENVQKEQGIIAQEIKMYEDIADWVLFFNTLKAMYVNHPNSIDIAGTIESINKITKEELYKCYHSFYSPSNMVLSIVGDLNWDKILEIAKKADLKDYMEGKDIERIKVDEPSIISRKEIVKEMSVSMPMFSLAYKGRSDKLTSLEVEKRDLETRLVLNLLFDGSSDINEYLKNNKLIFDSLSYMNASDIDYSYAIISGETEEVDKVVSLIKKEIDKFKKEKIKEEDFNRVKKSILGSVVRLSDNIEALAESVTSAHFSKLNVNDRWKLLHEITLEDVNRRLTEFFEEEMSVLSIINPIGEKIDE